MHESCKESHWCSICSANNMRATDLNINLLDPHGTFKQLFAPYTTEDSMLLKSRTTIHRHNKTLNLP